MFSFLVFQQNVTCIFFNITTDYDNNFTPTFNQTVYDFVDEVSSMSPANTDVGRVFATDSDASTYGQFSYSLTPTNASQNFFKVMITHALSVRF